MKRSILTEYNPRKQRQLDIRDAREEGIEIGRADMLRQIEAERANTVRQVELERVNNIRIFLKNGGSKEQAKQLLDATNEELQKVENM